jgi:hypothetical protein
MERRKFAQAPDPYWNVPKKPSKRAQWTGGIALGATLLTMLGAMPVVASYCTTQIVKSPSRAAWGGAMKVNEIATVGGVAVQKAQASRQPVAKSRALTGLEEARQVAQAEVRNP